MTRFRFKIVTRGAALLASVGAAAALSACGTQSSTAQDAASPTADRGGICQQLTGNSSCGIEATAMSTPARQLPANSVPRGQAASVLHLYFGEFYSLNAGRRYVYDGVAGTFDLTPASSGPNSGTFRMSEGFTQGLSMPWSFAGTGTYTYSPASDVYEFSFAPGGCLFGTGTLTAANGQLIGTLTLDGSISTTFAIPYTTA